MDLLILTGSSSDLPLTTEGLSLLKAMGVTYHLRIASAHRSPALVQLLLEEFTRQNGKVCICVAGMSAHLAGVVAAATTKPVLAVPVFRQETAGLDALLSMGQMPAGIPVATFGFGKSGFVNACLHSVEILALQDAALEEKLRLHRKALEEKVLTDDKTYAEFWAGPPH